MKTEQYIISGMSCAACSAAVQRVVTRLEGVYSADVNLITGKMTVAFDETKVGSADFFRVVEKAGFGIAADLPEKREKKKEEKTESPLPIIISAVFSSLLLYISMGQMLFEDLPLPRFINMTYNPYNFALSQLLLCLPALFFGRSFFIKGIPLLFKGRPNMDTLVSVGAGAALIFSLVMTYRIAYDPHALHNLYYESVAVVITLVMLGKFLERRSKAKTADAIKKLVELSPDTALLLKDGKEYILDLKEIAVGDILSVHAGAKIPLDGIVIEGQGDADESMLTGESLPVYKKVGDKVTGGSLNLNGHIIVKVTHIGDDTALSKIIKFVEDAQSKKAPISKTADKVAGVFVPVVISIAILAAVIWLIAGKDIAFALKVFTSVLVVACPCALGLATPTAIMVGTGLGALSGILIRNGEVLETTHKIKAAVFDKTGTLTKGSAALSDIISDDPDGFLIFTASAEQGSDHPLAKAILKAAEGRELSEAQDFKSLSGNGVSAVIKGKRVLVGKEELLSQSGVDTSGLKGQADLLSAQGKSLVWTAVNGQCLGFAALTDPLKETSLKAFQKLKAAGIKTVILSGDNKLCAEYIGQALGADEVYSEVLPEEKAHIIEKIRALHGSVIMVGDGINDAPALTKADVGCAIGSGSDIAIESADIVLMKNDPMDVWKAIRLSRLTITNIKQNLFWAFCYNTLLIPVAAGVLFALGGPLMSPMLGGLAMSLSSVFVVTNALRLRGKKL